MIEVSRKDLRLSSTFVEHLAILRVLEVANDFTLKKNDEVEIWSDSQASIAVWNRVCAAEHALDDWERQIAERDSTISTFFKGLKKFEIETIRKIKRKVEATTQVEVRVEKVKSQDVDLLDPLCLGNHAADVHAGLAATGQVKSPTTRWPKGDVSFTMCWNCKQEIGNAQISQKVNEELLTRYEKIKKEQEAEV